MVRRVRSLLVAASVAGVLSVAAPGTASACSCVVAALDDRLMQPEIGVVFSGSVAAEDRPASVSRSDELVTWTFDVDAVYRGTVGDSAQVRSAVSDASCGITFVVDTRYVVLARVDSDGAATAMLCDGSAPFDELSAADRTALGSGTAPTAGLTSPTAPESGSTWSNPATWTAAAAAFAALVGAIMFIRRRSSRD